MENKIQDGTHQMKLRVEEDRVDVELPLEVLVENVDFPRVVRPTLGS